MLSVVRVDLHIVSPFFQSFLASQLPVVLASNNLLKVSNFKDASSD